MVLQETLCSAGRDIYEERVEKEVATEIEKTQDKKETESRGPTEKRAAGAGLNEQQETK